MSSKNYPINIVTRFVGFVCNQARALIGNTRGGVILYISVLLPVLIGGALLAIDASRLQSLQTDLQKAADGMALAAAAELNLEADAIVRADRAVANLLKNPQKFGTTPAIITAADVNTRYLKSPCVPL